jgi:hypothetical protein
MIVLAPSPFSLLRRSQRTSINYSLSLSLFYFLPCHQLFSVEDKEICHDKK